jgi:hypothetical protein
MKKLLIIILATISIGIFSHTNSISGGLIGAKYAGEFMAVGVGARALAMGGAFVAVSNDVSAGYWNPAGLSNLNFPQVSAMYAERFAKLINYNYGAFAMPTGPKTTLALSITRIGIDDIPITALRNRQLELGEIYYENGKKMINTPYIVKTINDAEWAVYLSYAKTVSERFAWGSNIKMVTKHVGDNSAWGLGFDVGLLYTLFPKLNIGLNIQDVTTTLLAWDTGRREAITPTVKTGAAYFWELPIIAGKIIPVFDLDIRFENRRYAAQFNIDRVSFDTHFGVEYEFRNIVALRAGYDIGNFAAGAGLKLPQLNVDYAFLSHDELGDTHRISLLISLNKNRFIRQK